MKILVKNKWILVHTKKRMRFSFCVRNLSVTGIDNWGVVLPNQSDELIKNNQWLNKSKYTSLMNHPTLI